MRAAGLPAPIATRRIFADAEEMPSDAGAYVLVIDLSDSIDLQFAAIPESTLDPGRYFYVGSARGAGGIRARVRRHMRHPKRRHWHVDRLTDAAAVSGAIAFPGERECDIVQALLGVPAVTVPVLGFGSSDCRTCDAHLLLCGD